LLFSGDETTDLGTDTGTPVTDDLVEGRTSFTGHVNWVEIALDATGEDADHLITPEERYTVAMARQ
jgi:arylsulfatase